MSPEPTVAAFPTAICSTTSLGGLVANQKTYVVSGAHSASIQTITTTGVISGITAPNYLAVGSTGEIIYFEGTSGADFTSCTRGADGTTGAIITSGTVLYHINVANLYNQLVREIIAIETRLGLTGWKDVGGGIVELAGTLTLTNAQMWGATLARVGKNMTLDGSATLGSACESVFQIQSTIPVTVASQASYEKSGIYSDLLTYDPSTYAPDIFNGITAILGHATIGSGNTTGQAWGMAAMALTLGTGDGILVAFEADVSHGGSDQTAIYTTTSKYGIQIVTQDHDSTCALLITGSSGSLWHKGIVIDTTALDTEANDSAIEVGSVFRMLPSGIIIIGTVNVAEVILGMSANTAGHEGVSLQHNGNEAFLTAIDCETAWHDFTVIANAFRLDLNGGANTHVFGSTGVHAQETYCVRKVVTKTGLADNVATEVFTITTTNEAGNTDGGVFSVNVHAVCSHGTANDGTKNSCKSFQAQFARAITSNGVGANSTVTEIAETASAAPDAGVKDVVAITMTVAETSEYITSVLFQVDISGSTTTTADVMAMVEVTYAGFLTPPVIA